ncbi:MAG TPA: hypothetical protein PKD53_07185, partial [Chloroflexaceae bacterium]|nr:hypothetical protein [Chloroflexaceae bacterium]
MAKPFVRTTVTALGLAALAVGLPACASESPTVSDPTSTLAAATSSATAPAPHSGATARPAGWSEESHGNDVAPNYAVVFPTDTVNTLTLTIAPDDWAAMQQDLDEINAASLDIRNQIRAAGPGLSREERLNPLVELTRAKYAGQAAAGSPVAATAQPGADPAGVPQDLSNRSPRWVPATIAFQGQERCVLSRASLGYTTAFCW